MPTLFMLRNLPIEIIMHPTRELLGNDKDPTKLITIEQQYCFPNWLL
jgi:hypothetical protein